MQSLSGPGVEVSNVAADSSLREPLQEGAFATGAWSLRCRVLKETPRAQSHGFGRHLTPLMHYLFIGRRFAANVAHHQPKELSD